MLAKFYPFEKGEISFSALSFLAMSLSIRWYATAPFSDPIPLICTDLSCPL